MTRPLPGGADGPAPPGVSAGVPDRLGAVPDAHGVTVAVHSAAAERIELCLFSPDGVHETTRLDFPERTGDIWHMHVAGLGPGALYGLRAHGPHDPARGLRFNPHKLLLDPYARALHGAFGAPDLLAGFRYESGDDLTLDTRDSAPAMPRAVVTDEAFDWQDDAPPRTPWDQTVIYEAHPRGLTMLDERVPEPLRGRFEGLASRAVIAHLLDLGVTAIELLPVHAHLSEPFLAAKGLTNYWGYNTAAFFVPEPRYQGPAGRAGFKEMVRRFHAAGIEVLLDVVYNHTAEGGALGPTLSLRGLDNAGYYRLHPDDPREYVNDTGCGNTLALERPAVMRLVLDSLRYWVEVMHVDGFRFDLATVLGRTATGFEADGAFLSALRQDPVLGRVKLIAEPWDIGPGGYQLGGFSAPVAEWNDRFRDTARRFWRGDAGVTPDLAARLLGSADIFDRAGRRAWSSVNFVTAHDGFTLADLVSHTERKNRANGEGNRDGHAHNFSSNGGVEGPTDDPVIMAHRAQRARNLMACTVLAQGVPMLLAGDETGNSQSGNNNAYCQDNAVGWVDWTGRDGPMHRFAAHLTGLRAAYPVLRQSRFLHGGRGADGEPDVVWLAPDGAAPGWEDEGLAILGLLLGGSAEAPEPPTGRALVIVNRGAAAVFRLPPGPVWTRVLDTALPDGRPPPGTEPGPDAAIGAETVVLLVDGVRPAGPRRHGD